MKKLLLIALFSLPFIVACSDDENEMKVSLGNAVIEYIDSRYEGARIRGSEYEENGLLEVEIVHEGKVKDVYFNSQNEWVYTSWDVRVKDLPQAVTSAVAGAYPGYRIDDADFIERYELSYYALELEKGGEREIMVNVTPGGEIVD